MSTHSEKTPLLHGDNYVFVWRFDGGWVLIMGHSPRNYNIAALLNPHSINLELK